MGIKSVVSIFFTTILFNVFLPSGDMGSDLFLMISTITFDLGDSIEMSGCRSCYGKSEEEVYYNRNSNQECQMCLDDFYGICGAYPLMLNKLNDLQSKRNCRNESWRINENHFFENGTHCKKKDKCCLEASIGTNIHKINFLNFIILKSGG